MITILPESASDILDEIKTIFPEHWEELALNKDKIPLEPLYEAYLQKEKAGELLLMVMRSEGKIIGYFVGFLGTSMHYASCRVCNLDIFYVKKEYRKQGAGLLMFQEVEKELRRRKIKLWHMGCKMHKDARYLFEKIEAKPIEYLYSKWLGD